MPEQTPEERLAEVIALELRKHRLAPLQVSGATCECGYWSGNESPGRTRPVGFSGLQWHHGQVAAAVVLAHLEAQGWGELAKAWDEGAEAEALERDGEDKEAPGFVFTFTCSMDNPYLAWDELPDQPGTYRSRPAARQAPVETGEKE